MQGIINLYKPKGVSSFGHISKLKHIFDTKKIGHSGTLDPIAEGVIVTCVGKATRLSDYIQAQDKQYLAKLVLGISTDTYDISGDITKKAVVSHLTDGKIHSVIQSFVGKQIQKAPIYSAKKVQGKRLYKYAVQNEQVELPSSQIEISQILIDDIKESSFNGHQVKELYLKVDCSKGTYIRSLCNDIGEELGVYGTMAELSRLSVGAFNIKESYCVSQLQQLKEEGELDKCFTPVEQALTLDTIRLNKSELRKYLTGIKFQVNKENADYIIKSHEDVLIGIGRVDDKRVLKGRVLLYEAD